MPRLAALQMPANFIPLTNSIMAELARRGVGRDEILSALARMGAGGAVPAGAARMLRDARRAGVDVKLLSDCNAVFIGHVLAAAGLHGCVGEVITNPAAFERDGAACGGGAAEAAEAAAPAEAQAAGGAGSQRQARRAAHRLVIAPRFAAPHRCPLCPSNLCKGEELRAIVATGGYRRVIYGGDGANDVCPARALREGDVLLARAGHALARYAVADAAAAAAAAAAAGAGGGGTGGGGGAPTIKADVLFWESHDELARLVERLVAESAGAAPARAGEPVVKQAPAAAEE